MVWLSSRGVGGDRILPLWDMGYEKYSVSAPATSHDRGLLERSLCSSSRKQAQGRKEVLLAVHSLHLEAGILLPRNVTIERPEPERVVSLVQETTHPGLCRTEKQPQAFVKLRANVWFQPLIRKSMRSERCNVRDPDRLQRLREIQCRSDLSPEA